MCRQAGLPKGVVNIVTGDGAVGDRKSVVQGKSVDLGGRRIIKKKKEKKKKKNTAELTVSGLRGKEVTAKTDMNEQNQTCIRQVKSHE